MIAELYAVEATLRNSAATQEQILALRLIAGACNYMLKRWEKLTYYAADQKVELTTTSWRTVLEEVPWEEKIGFSQVIINLQSEVRSFIPSQNPVH